MPNSFLHRLFLVLLVLGLAFSSLAQDKPAPDPAASRNTTLGESVKLDVTVGGQTTALTRGERWTKFEQYRDVPKGFVLYDLNFAVEKEGSPWYFGGTARNATQLDQRYRVVLERYGRSRTEFRFEGFPNFLSRLTQTPLNQQTPGIYAIASSIRSSLQSAANADVPPIINNLIASTPFGDLHPRRQRYWFRQEFTLSQTLDTFVSFSREHRTGLKPIGLGSYERIGQPTGGFFNLLGNELPEPVNYDTSEVRAALVFHNSRAMLRVEYGASWFENQNPVLRWENPFSLTDQQATGSGGVANRWRFATGQFQLNPDNRAQTVTVAGRLNLPAKSFLAALAAWSFWRQDEPFLPWTLNTAVVTGVPAGVNPTSTASLPRPNLDGEVNIFNSDVVLGTRNWSKLALTARYRIYRYRNETEPLPLLGYVAFGDSFWRSNIANVPFPEINEPSSYTRQQATVEGTWKPAREFQLVVAPFWEGWNRTHRQASRSNEWGFKTQVLYKPLRWFELRSNYRYGNRIPLTYIVGPFEFSGLTSGVPPGGFTSGLRMFDQAHRNRNNADITLNFGNGSPWSVAATYSYLGDHYDARFFGLSRYFVGTAGIDVNYAPSENLGFVAYYNHDRVRSGYRSIAKGGGAFTWVLDNEWDRDTRDKVDSFGVGFNASAFSQRFLFNASYDLSLADQRINTFNPNTIRSDAINDATAFPSCARPNVTSCWPDVKSRFHELRLEARYRFRPNLEAGVRYLFEPYRLDDFAWDIMRPNMFGFEAPENDARRILFLNSRYGSMDAQLVGLYVRFIF